jgi:hypothetical protein
LEKGEENPIWTLVQVSGQGEPGAKAKEPGAAFPEFRFTQKTEPRKADEQAQPAPQVPGGEKALVFPKDFQGKVVFLTFWGTWCKECMAEVPVISAHGGGNQGPDGLRRGFGERDGPEAVMLQTVKDKGIRYPVLFDPDSLLPDRLQATAFPLNLFIGKDGKVLYAGSSIPETWREYLK